MLRSRVSKALDLSRLGQAVMRPGIDPRVWVSYAVVTSEPVVETTAGEQDVFVDVLMLPTNMEATARLGATYAGNGFGFYAPLHVDDEVVVVAPSGNPSEGLIIAHRLWSPSDPPPELASEHPEDVILVVESDKNVRMKMQGAGGLFLDVDDGGSITVNVVGSGDVSINVDGGKVKLGSGNADKAVGRVDDDVQITLTPADIVTMGLTSPSGSVVATNPVTVTGKITSGAAKVVAS